MESFRIGRQRELPFKEFLPTRVSPVTESAHPQGNPRRDTQGYTTRQIDLIRDYVNHYPHAGTHEQRMEQLLELQDAGIIPKVTGRGNPKEIAELYSRTNRELREFLDSSGRVIDTEA